MNRYFPKNVSGAVSAGFRALGGQDVPVEKKVSQIFGGGNVSTTEANGNGPKRTESYNK